MKENTELAAFKNRATLLFFIISMHYFGNLKNPVFISTNIMLSRTTGFLSLRVFPFPGPSRQWQSQA